MSARQDILDPSAAMPRRVNCARPCAIIRSGEHDVVGRRTGIILANRGPHANDGIRNANALPFTANHPGWHKSIPQTGDAA